MATASNRSLLGTALSQRWRIVQKLGEGSLGEVYAAEPVSGGARVAVKVLLAEFASDSLVRARFLDGARACMRLAHPNVVRILECAAHDDQTPYVVMELLDGVPLGAYTHNGGRVAIAQAVPILQGILAALAAAHAQGFVHRDLKPDNVFLTRNPSGAFVVKVLDFGVAGVMDAAGGTGSRTRSGMLLGTAAYLSPEQARNAADVDQRADVWSAGVMLYEMLTGRIAFPAPTEYARLAAVLTSEPEPMNRLDPELAPLSSVVARALKKNRDERYSSALEMGRALSAAIGEGTRTDASVGFPPAAAAPALSRLPDVAPLFAPSAGAVSAGASSAVRTSAASAAPIEARRPGGGTLASAAESPPTVDTPPHVAIAPEPLGGTLPSKNVPSRLDRAALAGRARGRLLTACLVALALVAGFVLGWLVARS